nr:synaptobrevin, longin-like domain protein [Tanacetum cinerariifolium]
MIAILEKTEHSIDFHEIVNFLEASHIRIETTNQETKILATIDGNPRTISKSSLRMHLKPNDEEWISSLLEAELFENLSLMGYNVLPNQRFTFQKGQFSHQWKFLIHTIMQCLSPKSTGFNEFSSNIATDVVCLATNRVYNFSKMIFNGMVRNINNELASLSRDDRQGEAFLTVSSLDAGQDRENIAKTTALPHESSPRVTSLDADEGRGIIEIGEELGADKSTELGSNDTEEMVNVLSLMEAMNILTSRGAAASVSSAEVLTTIGVPTVSGSFPTVSAIFTTGSVVTRYTRRPRGITIRGVQHMRSLTIGVKDKGKQKVVESEVPKKRKLQEQIDAQVAKEIEEEFARENQRLNEQLARDSEIARLHAEEELKMMIEGLDRSNEEKMEFYMSVLKSHTGWKTKHFRGMTLEQLKEKFIPVWKQFEDFVLMNSKKESERIKRQGFKIDQGSSKRMKTSKSVSEDIFKEELKGMMQLVPLEEVYVEALQVKHPIIDWEIHFEGKREYWKIIRLGGHTTVYRFFVDILKQFDREDLHKL